MITATEISCLNELGNRANNEDCISPKKGAATLNETLFIVCDGVGGEKKGEVASEIVCASIREYFKNETPVGGEEKESIQKAIQYANEKLAVYVSTDSMAKRMSTTLALVLLGERSVIAAWCGDTRIHHIRNGKVVWKSKDHSLVSELISQGELTEEEARTYPRRNVITRSLNASNFNNSVDFHEILDFETGDYLLLCTDGLLEKVNENIIYTILTDETEKDKAKGFLSYCDGITRDNFSMYLIKGRHITRKTRLPVLRSVLIISVLLLIIIIIAFLA
ncbi:MAG: protein phosphatase 2C domain-containing protein [Chitinophagaceae bacterium]